MEKQPDPCCLPLSETVAPAEASAVAEAVRSAAEASTAVYPIGGGTCLDYGARPSRTGLGLSLGKLNRVVDHAARDLTITVGAGITVARLQKTLAAKRQRLPIEVPFPDRATIGGAVATGAAGPSRYRWGTIRDYVLGLRVVDGTGTEFAAGGRVVKNAAGYNLCRLLTGSLGTLGVITQVTLMVRPVAESSGWIVCEVADFPMAERLLAGMIQTETLPTAIEWLLLGPADGALDTAGRLAVGFEGSKTEVEWMLDCLACQWKRSGVDSPAVMAKREGEAFHRSLTDFGADGTDDPGRLTVRISVLPGVVVRTVEQIFQTVPDASIQVHAGDGVIVAKIPLEPNDVPAMVHDRLRPLVERAGGTMVVLRAPAGVALDAALVWGPPGEGFRVMRAIKERFDPKNILNPGRFVFNDS